MTFVSPAPLELPRENRLRVLFRRHGTMQVGGALLLLMVALAVLAPWLGTVDPQAVAPSVRLRGSQQGHWFGTDMLGRDVYSRTIYGARISLIIGISVALLSVFIGVLIAVVSSYVRILDAIVMRVMDGFMSIPALLLAIALMTLTRASIGNVIVAITVVEVPRVVRLVRALVLSLREQLFVEAAVASGTGFVRTLAVHILPHTLSSLLVQGSYIFAHAMIVESILSFIGAGTPPSIPSWGNILAEGRSIFLVAPHVIFFPGLFLSVTVLAVNLMGDGLRDALDPRIARQM